MTRFMHASLDNAPYEDAYRFVTDVRTYIKGVQLREQSKTLVENEVRR